MLAIKLIDDQAALNNFKYVEANEYVAGEAIVIKFQIQDPQTLQRLIPGAAGTMDVIFQNSDGTFTTIAASKLFPSDDRSLWSVPLSGVDTTNLVGSNFKVVLDFLGDTTDIRTGMSFNSLSKITFDGEC